MLCFLLCIVFSPFLYGQEKDNIVPLSQILPLLEKRFQTTFTYADATIEDISVYLPPATLSLQETLDLISFRKPLQFIVFKETIIIQQRDIDPFTNQMMDEIVISQYLAKGIDLRNDGAIAISPKEFNILPGLNEPDILQTIKALPGITSTDESITNLNIRGGTNDQNLLLWDGIKMYQSGHFFGMITAFDPYIINTVEVTKNGTAARLGDGVSGTINMSLDNTIDKKTEANAGLNFIQASGLVKVPIQKNLELQLSARRAITDVLQSVTYLIYFDRVFNNTEVTNSTSAIDNDVETNQEFYFYDVSGKMLFEPTKKDKISLSFLTIGNELAFTENAINTTFENSLNSGLSQNNIAANVLYKRMWNKKIRTEVSTYVSSYSLKGENADGINNQQLTQANEVLDTGLRIENFHQANDLLKWNYGYQFNEVGITNVTDVNNPAFFKSVTEVLQSHAGYGQLQFNDAKNRTHISAGLRTTFYSEFDKLFIEPRISANYKVSDGLEASLLGEFKHQTTSQIIDLPNDFLGIERRKWVLANEDDIPIVNSNQISIGLQYNKYKWTLSAEGYVKNVNGITARSQGFLNQYQFVNDTGSYQVTGMDFLVQKRFTNFRSWLGYSYSVNTYDFETLNDGVPFPNNVDVRHNITINNTYSKDEINIGVGINWYSGIPNTGLGNPPLTQNREINFSSPNAQRIEDFFRVDLSATYDLKLGKKTNTKIGLSLWNIINQRQTILQYFQEVDGEIVSFEQQSLGITPNLSVRVFF